MMVRGHRARWLIASAVWVVAVFYLVAAGSEYLASAAAASTEGSRLQRAVRLEPSNAAYHDLLGSHYFFVRQDVPAAIAEYRVATALNPYESRFWLDLADAYFVAGDRPGQLHAVEQAVKFDPTTPSVAWRAANYYVTANEIDRALAEFSVVMQHDASLSARAVQLCWRATHDVGRVHKVLPPKPELYFSLINYLVEQSENDAADQTWLRLLSLRKSFPPNEAFPYLDSLISRRAVDSAREAWVSMAPLIPQLKTYLPSENLVVNGGFEEDVLNGGFDWRYKYTPGIGLSLDHTELHTGVRSLSISFDRTRAGDTGLFQYVAVEPNTEYEFQNFVKAARLETASGIRFFVRDAFTRTTYVETPDVTGTTAWHEQRARFRTNAGTNLLVVSVGRDPGDAMISGKAWIDDVRLSKVAR